MIFTIEQETIAKIIIQTICWFDLFDYPLTNVEVWRYGFYAQKNSLSEIDELLKQLVLDGRVVVLESFFVLPGRESLISKRKERYNLMETKYRKARRIARLFHFFPWFKLTAIGNLVGSHNLRREGDIDLFIVAQKNRLWLTRLTAVVLVNLLGLRPSRKKTKDTICLSFYVSEESLDLSQFTQGNDYYFYYWLAFLMPIFERGNAYGKLVAENQWLLEKLPNFQFAQDYKRLRSAGETYFFGRVVDALFGWLEGIAKKIQLDKLNPEIRKVMNLDTRVVLNDRALKFHVIDRRQEINAKSAEKFKQVWPS